MEEKIMANPWERYQNIEQPPSMKPWEKYGGTSEMPQEKDFAARMKEDFAKRKEDIARSQIETQLGKRSNIANAINATGEGVGLMFDAAGNVIGSAYRQLPESVRGAISQGAVQGISGIGQGINAIAPNAKQGLDYLAGKQQEFVKNKPITADVVGGLANIGSVVPVGKVTKQVGQAALDVARNPQVVEAAVKGAGNTLKMTKNVAMSPVTLAKKAFPEKAPILGSEQLAQNASTLYKSAADYGGTLKPEVTNKFVSTIEQLAPQTELGKTLAGENTFTKTIEKIRTFKDKPIDLNSAQEIDEILGDIVDSEIVMGRPSKQGKKILDIQNAFRESIDNATEAEVAGGKQGFEALKQARAEWSKAAKTRDIERIIARAEQMDNPATGIKNGFRTLANNPNRLRGYPDNVRKAIAAAANSGTINDTLRTIIGSRLVSGLMGNAAGGFGGAVASQAASAAARGAAARMQLGKAEKVLRLIQEGKKPSMAEIKKMKPKDAMETMSLIKQTEGMNAQQLQDFQKTLSKMQQTSVPIKKPPTTIANVQSYGEDAFAPQIIIGDKVQNLNQIYKTKEEALKVSQQWQKAMDDILAGKQIDLTNQEAVDYFADKAFRAAYPETAEDLIKRGLDPYTIQANRYKQKLKFE